MVHSGNMIFDLQMCLCSLIDICHTERILIQPGIELRYSFFHLEL